MANAAICVHCGEEGRRRGKAPPSGWKAGPAGGLLCKGCLGGFATRAVALPVMGVLAGGDVEEFCQVMRVAFRAGTDMWNWSVRRLLAADVLRTPDAGPSMPPMPELDLYALYNQEGRPLGDVATQTRTSLLRMAKAAYVKARHPALWLGRQSLPLTRYPAPFPVHNQGWRPSFEAAAGSSRTPAVRLRLTGQDSGPAWLLRLAAGRPFARQLAGYEDLVAGRAARRQLDLYVQPCRQGEQGVILAFRQTSGGQRVPCRLMCKMVGSFPRRPPGAAGAEAMVLRTDPNAFWVAEIQGRSERPWILNGDHVAASIRMMEAWHRDHAAWLQRVGEDRKHEKRWPLKQRRQFADAYARRCVKHHRRVKTWVEQMVAQAVGFAKRRNVGEIHYDDADRAFADSFPWFRVRQHLELRCGEAGIALVAAGAAHAESA